MTARDLFVLDNGLELTWLGHSTWLMKTPGGNRFLFDPWLGNPSCPEGTRHRLGPCGDEFQVLDVEPGGTIR